MFKWFYYRTCWPIWITNIKSSLNRRLGQTTTFMLFIVLISLHIQSFVNMYLHFRSALDLVVKARKERVAICIAGSARTFHYRGVHENIYRNAVYPLLQNYNTNVFFIINVDNNDPGPMKRGTRHAISRFRPTQVIEIQNINSFPSYDGRFIPNSRSAKPSSLLAPKWCNHSGSMKISFSHTLYRTSQCMDIIEKYEVRRGIKFSWIYKLRPDVVFLDPLSTPHQLKEDIFYTAPWSGRFSSPFSRWWMEYKNSSSAGNGSIGDQFLIASRKVAEKAFRAFDIIDDCDMYRCPLPNSESQLRMWLVKNKIAYQQLPELWDIVRQNVYDCSWMQYIEMPNLDLRNRIRKCEIFRKSHADILPKSSDNQRSD